MWYFLGGLIIYLALSRRLTHYLSLTERDADSGSATSTPLPTSPRYAGEGGIRGEGIIRITPRGWSVVPYSGRSAPGSAWNEHPNIRVEVPDPPLK